MKQLYTHQIPDPVAPGTPTPLFPVPSLSPEVLDLLRESDPEIAAQMQELAAAAGEPQNAAQGESNDSESSPGFGAAEPLAPSAAIGELSVSSAESQDATPEVAAPPIVEDATGIGNDGARVRDGLPAAREVRFGPDGVFHLPETVRLISEQQQILEVPFSLVLDSRHRKRLPFDPASKKYQAVLDRLTREGQSEPLPARFIDGHFEVLARELEFDVLRVLMPRTLLIRRIHVGSEREAYLYGTGDDLLHSPLKPYEIMLEIRDYEPFLEQGGTQEEVGDRLGISNTTVSHYHTYGAEITPDRLLKAGVSVGNQEHAQRLRQIKRDQLRWIAKEKTEATVLERLEDVILKDGGKWKEYERKEKARLGGRSAGAQSASRPTARPEKPFEIPTPVDGLMCPIFDVSRGTQGLVNQFIQQLREQLLKAIEKGTKNG